MTTPTTSIPADGFGDLIVWRDETARSGQTDPTLRTTVIRCHTLATRRIPS